MNTRILLVCFRIPFSGGKITYNFLKLHEKGKKRSDFRLCLHKRLFSYLLVCSYMVLWNAAQVMIRGYRPFVANEMFSICSTEEYSWLSIMFFKGRNNKRFRSREWRGKEKERKKENTAEKQKERGGGSNKTIIGKKHQKQRVYKPEEQKD